MGESALLSDWCVGFGEVPLLRDTEGTVQSGDEKEEESCTEVLSI